MAKIHLKRNHSQDLEHAKQYAEDLAESLSDKFGVKHDWDGLTVRFKGAGAKGLMTIDHGVVEVKMELSLMLRPFKGRIEQEINRLLDDFAS